jgi:hypothetical protein
MNAPTMPAVRLDMPMRDYLSVKALSSGVCQRLLSESPLHARLASPWNDSRDADNSKVADVGSAAHKALLEGTEDGICVIEADDWRTKAAKELRDAAYLEGRIPMLAGKMHAVRAMVTAAREYLAHSEIKGIFDDGGPEVTLLFCLRGVPCKARCDWLTADRRICLSYKTTQGSANPDSWIRTQLPQYDVATMFYERGVLAACEVDQTACIHLIQEQNYPFACSLVGLAPAYRGIAEYRLDVALTTWERCSASGNWPAYPSRIAWAEPRSWQQTEAEEHQNDDSAFFNDDELKGGLPL